MKKSVNPGGPIFGPLLSELEQRFFTRTPIANLTARVQIISCRHCNLEMQYDDNDHEQAAGAAELFLKHLRVRHADVLKQQAPLFIDKL